MADLLSTLNAPQAQAVRTTEGPVLVLAGAGTGKTRVLTTRLTHILAQGLCAPSEILAVTFTNKASKEMTERVEHLIGRPAAGMWIGTFHALALKILRRNAELVGLKPDLTILDTDDQTRLAKQILADKGVDDNRWPAKAFVQMVSRWKDNAWTPDDVPLDDASGFANGRGAELYRLYQQRLQQLNACDFGDLLLHNLTLFKKNPDVAARYQRQFRYILVDEYQDTNVVQYLWLRMLALGHGNICVVGDDDQSIYAWRGAQVGNILRFERDFPGASVVRLEQNYRSTGHILRTASHLISHNTERHDKTLWTQGDKGLPVEIHPLFDERDEARFIATDIEKNLKEGHAYSDFALLMRTAAQTRPFEERFVQMGLPYQVLGGQRFYERKEIRDALAYLRLVSTPADDLAFERIHNLPRRGIGESTYEQLRTEAARRSLSLFDATRSTLNDGLISGKAANGLRQLCDLVDGWRLLMPAWAPDQLMEKILEESGYVAMLRDDKNQEEAKGRLDNLKELVRAMQEYPDVPAFLEHVALVMDVDADESNAVKLMTVHGAKGLEFDTVFIPGFEDGLFPHQRALDDTGEKGLEEERRLAYVAITRGRRRVVLSYASSRRLYGGYMPSTPSRFLQEFPDDSIRYVQSQRGGDRAWGTAGSWAPKTNEPLLAAELAHVSDDDDGDDVNLGTRVFHEKFGYGRVKGIEGQPGTRKLLIAFEKAGEKKLVESMANLRKVTS